jgi:hypothetical protein
MEEKARRQTLCLPGGAGGRTFNRILPLRHGPRLEMRHFDALLACEQDVHQLNSPYFKA